MPRSRITLNLVLSCRISILRAAKQDLKAVSALQKHNERLTLAGELRLKATPVIFRHGIEHIHRNAIAGVIMGLGLLTIGGVFVILWVNLFISLPLPYPVTLMMTAVFVINVVNFKAVIYSCCTYISIRTFMLSLEKKREQLQEKNISLVRKKLKLPSSELLLLLFDAGFSDNMYSAFGLIDASLTTLSSHFAHDSDMLDLDSNHIHKHLLREHKSLAESLKRVCNEIEKEYNKFPVVCDFTAHLNRVQSKLQVDLCWDIVSLILNSVACFGFFLFPILTFFPSASADYNLHAMYFGSLVGNMAWLIESVLFVLYNYQKHTTLVDAPADDLGFKKKNN